MTTIDYRQKLPVLHSFSGILHPIGSRHDLRGDTWEVVEHRDGVAYILPIGVIAEATKLGASVTAPWPGGYEWTDAPDSAELLRDNDHVVGMVIVRNNLRFSWIIAG